MREQPASLDGPDGVFVDPFLLTLTIVMTILLIFGNVYFLAHYAHYADSFFGSSTAAKAVLVSSRIQFVHAQLTTLSFTQVVGYIIAQCQILLLPLDVQNSRENTNIDMRMFWYVIQMSSLFYICVVLPFGLYYAESDEEKNFVSS